MNLNTYLQQLDLAKLDLQPLNEHFIAEQLNEQEKELYLTMISSFVLLDDLTESRTRLFQLYLQACKTQHQQGKLFNLAQNISKDQIKEFIKLCEEKSLKESFFVDAFIFSRLDKPLTEKINEIFNEWICLFLLSNETIENIIYFVSNILGLGCKYQLTYIFDIKKLNIWIPYCLEEFDNNFKKNKAYYVDGFFDFNDSLEIYDCIFFFNYNSGFKVSGGEYLLIENCFFSNSAFVLRDLYKINVKNSFFMGLNSESVNLFDIKGETFWGIENNSYFESNNFENINGRVLNLNQELTISKCKFKNCGQKDLVGGAIYTIRNIRIHESEFERCVAKVAGAIYCRGLDEENGILKCVFNTCLSLDYQDAFNPGKWNDNWNTSKELHRGKLNAGGLWIDGRAIKGIFDTMFIACNIYIEKSSHASRSDLIYRSQFIDSILSVGDSDSYILNECNFKKGKYQLDSNIYTNVGELKINT